MVAGAHAGPSVAPWSSRSSLQAPRWGAARPRCRLLTGGFLTLRTPAGRTSLWKRFAMQQTRAIPLVSITLGGPGSLECLENAIWRSHLTGCVVQQKKDMHKRNSYWPAFTFWG